MTTSSTTLSPPPLLPVPRSDFPTWLPAMLVKELRQGLRTRGFVGAFILFQVIMVLLMLSTVLGSAFGNTSTRAVMATTINGFFWTLLGVQLLLVTPGRALGSLQVELESRSLDLLMLTRLSAWRVVLGKWGSLMAQACLLFVAMLPYGIVRYFMGSVNLVEDAYLSASLLGGCAVLTAAGLACSGMPKVARILLPILVVVSFQTVRPLMMMMSGRSGTGGSPFGGGRGGDDWVMWVNGALVLGIFLVATVRRIAPPAENHVVLSRGLALLALLPVPLLSALGQTGSARGQFAFAAVLLAVIAIVDHASMRWPMLPHWRPWAVRGGAARWLGRCALPGWPSGFAFALLAGALLAAAGLLLGLAGSTGPAHLAWLVLLAVEALVFPAMVLSFFRSGRAPGARYVLVLAVSCFVAAFAGVISNLPDGSPGVLGFASIFPGAGFWIALTSPQSVGPTEQIFQWLFALAVLGTAWWRSHVYWQHLAQIDARVRAAKA